MNGPSVEVLTTKRDATGRRVVCILEKFQGVSPHGRRKLPRWVLAVYSGRGPPSPDDTISSGTHENAFRVYPLHERSSEMSGYSSRAHRRASAKKQEEICYHYGESTGSQVAPRRP